MNTWAPLFSKIVDSSLWRESDLVVKVFLTMLAKKDADQVVRASAFMIGEWAKKTEKEALQALEILSQPDKRRLEKQPFDGRRIQKVEDGWLILNGQYYEEMMRKINRRSYKAAKQAEYRKTRRKGPGSMEQINERLERAPEGTSHFQEDPVPYAPSTPVKM